MPDKLQPVQPQPRLPPSPDQLLSARAAALQLHVNPRTAQLRARRALRAGDPLMQMIAGAYVAPLWWWQLLLAKPMKVGRPRTDA
jgi:hypothetical protein